MAAQEKKSARGCLFYGAIIGGFLLLVLLVTSYLGVRYAKNLINEFTDAQPTTLPVVQMSEAETGRLRERLATFRKAVDERQVVGSFSITADEVNALIATDPDFAKLKGRVYVTFDDDQVKAQVTFPAEQIGFRPLQGRYINATGAFAVSLHDGFLKVSPESLSAKGKPLPENIMRHIRVVAENFAVQWNQEPKFKAAISKIEEIQVKDGKLIITPKPAEPTGSPNSAGPP